jgi:hypothetical protein
MNVALLGKTAYNNTLARINRQRGSTLQQYGYLGDVDPTTGVLANVRVDPNNRFGDFQSLLRSHADQAQQAEFNSQERGLHGGMANKAQSDLKYGFGQDSAHLGQNFANQFTDYQDQQSQAKYDYDKALYEQQLQDAQNAIANGDFNPANYGDSSSGSGDYSAPYDGGTLSAATDPYTGAAAEHIAGGYGGYVNAPGGGASAVAAANAALKKAKAPAKPSAARVAKTVAKVVAKKKPTFTQVKKKK